MFDIMAIVKTAGYLGLSGIIFAESGLLIGFFFPGDSLLFTAGFLASRGFLNIWFLMGCTFAAAVLGDSVGYMFGKSVGPALFNKKDSWFFKQENVDKAKIFFEKHGSKTIVLARFVPIVRTFVPILAGVGTMNYRIFISYNIIGGALWALGLSLLGYFLGSLIPNIDNYLLPIILLIIILSISPSFVHIWRERKNKIKSVI